MNDAAAMGGSPANDAGASRGSLAPDWAAYVERGRRWRKANDDTNWGLGDDVVEMCNVLGFDPKPGRPPANENVRTLAEYAAEVDISSKRVSECYANSRFYGNARTSGDYATWAHHDRARRASDGTLDNALELLAHAQAVKLHYRAFVRYLDGILFEGMARADELSPRLRAFLGEEAEAWVTIAISKADA